MNARKILIVDNDIPQLPDHFLMGEGYETIRMNTGKKAMEWLQYNKADLVLCNFCLEDMLGIKLLANIKENSPSVPVIIITRQSDVKEAIQVMKIGACDYITKPLLPAETSLIIKKALNEEQANKAQHVSKTSKTVFLPVKNTLKPASGAYAYQYIIGNSPAFAKVMKQVELVAPTNYSVILYGETGSGKELIAQQIHQKSNRSGKPFIAIDCGALSKELAGSELFGHEKGAFTGALNQKCGSLELANGGTIFLDEISNLSYGIQIALLRVVQERKIRRLGGTKDIFIDIRIIVASNEDLWNATRTGKFREDLYHRFNEFTVELPPLRKRKEDIILYATHFLQLTNAELGKEVKGFTKEVEELFNSYPWYGNLRELKNAVKRATLLTNGDRVEAISLPVEISNYKKQFINTENSVKKKSLQPQLV